MNLLIQIFNLSYSVSQKSKHKLINEIMKDVKIKQLEKKDFDKARKFAIEGMHLSRYTTNNIELYLYSKYFWYMEISKATKALGAYINDDLVGVLLARINNEPIVFSSVLYRTCVKIVSYIINICYKDIAGKYDDANIDMLEKFKRQNNPDGEILFFAVAPDIKGKGIGTFLLNELNVLEKGKHLYLYTDSGSTYQFYSHRGFNKEEERNIEYIVNKKSIPLTCFLYSKKL